MEGGLSATPVLVLDPSVVEQRFAELAAAFPGTEIHYAVKANPEPAVLHRLVGSGSRFDVASLGEVAGCLAAGASPAALCFGNPIKKPADVAAAYELGVRRFVTDSAEDLAVLAQHAPGAAVLCRLLVDDTGSATPFGGKFGCAPDAAVQLLAAARDAGLRAEGLAFHVGSQQLDPGAWRAPVALAAKVAADAGLDDLTLDLGGGLPARYATPVPALGEFASAIRAAVAENFARPPRLLLEPGRALVAGAGVIRAEVVRVSARPGVDDRRWVYLDVGRYGGLAETEGEAIVYRLRVPSRSASRTAPVVLAGPSCDGDDVLYRRARVELPVDLAAGDIVEILSAGAYTASYAAVGFNGFPPLAVHVLGS
ncbi:MAG: Ornithine decarboxylase [Pseudonocardia sp.]|nr:Ornithine decarboxylase [Pseudonocardia sp.]